MEKYKVVFVIETEHSEQAIVDAMMDGVLHKAGQIKSVMVDGEDYTPEVY